MINLTRKNQSSHKELKAFPCLSRAARSVATGIIALMLMTSPKMPGAPANILIIKGDDVTNAYTKSLNFRSFIERSHELGAKVSMGVVCADVTESSRDVFKSLLRDYKDSEKVEFWNHGWSTQGADFGSGDYAYQKELYTRCQNAMKNASYYGKTPIAFGAPGNAINGEITAQVMNEDPDTRLFFGYNRPATLEPDVAFVYILKGENNSPRYVDITRSVEGLNSSFRASGSGTNVVALQFHPGNFSAQENLDYDTVINHALDNGWTIMLPREYMESITVTSAPVITTQPATQAVFEGSRVRFTAAASGGPAPTYQWQSAAPGSSNFTDIPGATGVRYTISSAALNQNGMRFRFVATNSQSQVISDAALLNVTVKPATPTSLVLTRTGGASPSIYGDSLVFRAVVSPDPGNGATVNFKSGGNLVGSATTNSGVADFTIATLSYSGGAPVDFSAEFPGSLNFETSANTLPGGQQVDRKTLTLSGATAQDKVFDGNTAALITGGSLSGLVSSDAITANTGTFAQSAVGTAIPVTVQLSGASIGNYTLTQPGLTANITTNVIPSGDPKWTNTAGGLWITTGNWDLGTIANGSGVTADFNTLDLIADAMVNLNSSLTIGNLIFGDTNTASAAGWTLANNGTPANIITLAGTTPTITVNTLGTGKKIVISALIAGTQGLLKAGIGTLALTGTNTYSGTTALNSGILQANHAAGLPATSYLLFNGGLLETSGTFSRALGTSGGTVGWVGSTSGGIGGGFSAKGGPLAINLGGAGSTISFSSLGGANLSGILRFGALSSDSNIIFHNGLGLNGAERVINVTAGIGGPAATSAEVKGVINGANTSGRLKKTGDGTLILSGANNWSNYTLIEGGMVIANRAQNGTTSGPLGTNGQIIFKGGTLGFTATSAAWDPSSRIAAATSTSAVSINTGGQIITFGSALSPSQSGGLIKLGTGKLILSGANTYIGATQVKEGTLTITGTLGATLVTVNTGATLSGNGDIGGSVTVQSNAHHALAVAATPGSQQTRDINGTLTLASGSILDLTAASAPAAGVYVLVTASGGITGPLPTVNLTGVSGTVAIRQNNLELTVGTIIGFTSTMDGFVSINPEKNPMDDEDKDGIPNLREYVFGTSLTTPDAAPAMGTAQSGTNCDFTFIAKKASGTQYAGLNRYYTIEENTDLSNPSSWIPVEGYTGIVGTDQTVTLSIPSGRSHAFYRLKIWLE